MYEKRSHSLLKRFFLASAVMLFLVGASKDSQFSTSDESLFKKHPSPFQSMPDAYFELLSRYMGTKAYDDCQATAQSLLQSDLNLTTVAMWRPLASANSAGKSFSHYLKACLDVVEDIKLPNRVLKPLKQYISRMGIFVRRIPFAGFLPFCAGIRIDTHRIMTAKHCFFDRDAQVSWELERRRTDATKIPDADIGVMLSVSPDTLFLQLGDLSKKLKVKFLQNGIDTERRFFPKDPTKLANDHTIVNVVNAKVEELEPLRIARPRQWDKLWFVAPIPDLANLNAIRNNTSEAPVVANYRIDNRPTCYIWAISNRCLFHSCQSLAGMSGTPLFSLDRETGVNLVGIHTGTIDRPQDLPCGFTRGKWIVNYGVAPIME